MSTDLKKPAAPAARAPRRPDAERAWPYLLAILTIALVIVAITGAVLKYNLEDNARTNKIATDCVQQGGAWLTNLGCVYSKPASR